MRLMSSQGVILQIATQLGIFYKVIHKTATFYKNIPFDLFPTHTNCQRKQCTRNPNIFQPPPPQQKYENQSLISEA